MRPAAGARPLRWGRCSEGVSRLSHGIAGQVRAVDGPYCEEAGDQRLSVLRKQALRLLLVLPEGGESMPYRARAGRALA